MSLKIPISIGELWDKYSILLIKREKIVDVLKLQHINTEISYLEPYINSSFLSIEIQKEILDCNNKLWDIEDAIRDKEQNKQFDEEFIQLARSVYIMNDKRAEIKYKINMLFNSDIVEVKSYNSK
jgi:hypothetical protein